MGFAQGEGLARGGAVAGDAGEEFVLVEGGEEEADAVGTAPHEIEKGVLAVDEVQVGRAREGWQAVVEEALQGGGGELGIG